MTTAIWIIAIVEIIRAVQNGIQMYIVAKSNSDREMKRATDEFVKSLNRSDEEFVKEILEKMGSGKE